MLVKCIYLITELINQVIKYIHFTNIYTLSKKSYILVKSIYLMV